MIGGMRLASEGICPSVVNFLDVMLRDPESTIRVEEILLGDGSPWIGKRLTEIDLRGSYELLPLHRKSDGAVKFNPRDDTITVKRRRPSGNGERSGCVEGSRSGREQDASSRHYELIPTLRRGNWRQRCIQMYKLLQPWNQVMRGVGTIKQRMDVQ